MGGGCILKDLLIKIPNLGSSRTTKDLFRIKSLKKLKKNHF